MKKLLSVLLTLLMFCTLVACSSSTSKEETTSDEAVTEETTSDTVTITVGMSPDYPPYESLDTNGEIVGFEIEMLNLFEDYLSEEYGATYKFDIQQMNFDNIITQIQGGQLNMGASGFSYSEERENAVAFSKPFCNSKQVAMVLADSSITSVSELEGAALAAQTGTTGEYAAQDLSDNCASIANVNDMVPGLDAGQYDAIVIDNAVAESYASTGKYKVLDETLVDEMNYLVVAKNDSELLEKIDFCIEKFVASEEYQTLCTEYGLSPVSE